MSVPQERIEKKAEEIALHEGRSAQEVTRYDLARAREEVHREVTGEANFGPGGAAPILDQSDESLASTEDPIRQEDVDESRAEGATRDR